MGQQLFLESIKECRDCWRNTHLTQYLCIVIAMYYSLHVFRLLTVLMESSMCIPSWQHFGNFSTLLQRELDAWRGFSMYILDLPELKIIKPSDTHWLSHEQCVKAIGTALNNIYEETYEPEVLRISKVLRKNSTVLSIFLLDYTSCWVAKLSKTLQSVQVDLSIISSLLTLLSIHLMTHYCQLPIGYSNY